MKPQNEWFRPPMWIDSLRRTGDVKPFFIVAQPEMRGKVFGVFYEVSAEFELTTPTSVLAQIALAAEQELMRRVEAGEGHGEGEVFEVYRWNPVFVRHMSGRVTIETGKRSFTVFDPMPTAPPIKTTDLHDDNQVGPRI